jgi:hypothetical protein
VSYPPSDPAEALAYGANRYLDGQFGKTLLVGWRATEPLFAVAAGLARDQDRERFAVLARYLLRRDGADGYWLLLTADIAGCGHLVAETLLAGRRTLLAAPLRPDGADFQRLGEPLPLPAEAPLGDLLDGGATLAGVMRRELDRLAESLAQPLPST